MERSLGSSPSKTPQRNRSSSPSDSIDTDGSGVTYPRDLLLEDYDYRSPLRRKKALFGGIYDIASLAYPANYGDSTIKSPSVFPPLSPDSNFTTALLKNTTSEKEKMKVHSTSTPNQSYPKSKGYKRVSSHNLPQAWSEVTQLPDYGLTMRKQAAQQSESIARLKLIKSGVHAIENLPLVYLFSIKHPLAIERAARILIKPALVSTQKLMAVMFSIWRHMPIRQVDDRQVQLIVLAKCFTNMLEKRYRKVFSWWALAYADRFKGSRLKYIEDAATYIQHWWLNIKKLISFPYRRLADAINLCLNRRRAIRHLVTFELKRKQGISKMRKGISKRRRMYMGCRSIQRIFRWNLLRVSIEYRLTRNIKARRIQRWRRMTLFRHKNDRYLMLQIIKYGGYTKVMSKVPKRHLANGFLQSLNACSSFLQRAWFASCGRMDQYLAAAARRAAAAYTEMLNEKSTIIQQSWRAHLWDLLLLAAKINNRARRIQRGFRAYQYRKWINYQVLTRTHRNATRLQRAYRNRRSKIVLAWRFKARKAVLIFTRAKKTICSMVIQRCYRNHVAWLKWVKEQLMAFYAAQRQTAAVALQAVSKIQLFWRKYWRVDFRVLLGTYGRIGWKLQSCKFSKSILLAFKNAIRSRNSKLSKMSIRIQVMVRKKIIRKRAKILRWKIHNVSKIWQFTKAYLLKLAIYDRIMATRRRKLYAANKIKRQLRITPLTRKLHLRFYIRKLQVQLVNFRNLAVLLIQRLTRRKLREYNMPLRKAARLNLKKQRSKKHILYLNRVFDNAARICQKFGRNILKWNIITKMVIRQERKLLEWRKSKILQRFCRWCSFTNHYNRVIEEKYARLKAEKILRLEIWAVNKIGRNWKRKCELFTLAEAFKRRKKTLEHAAMLRAEREKAEEEKRIAEAEKKATDDLLEATINAAWKQGSDAFGKNYYYNYVNGESTWEPPDKMTNTVTDTWIKNIDARGNVYYYNMKTEESRWLPPCSVCGTESERYCSDCQVAFCMKHFEPTHITQPLPDPDFANHIWSLVEYEKDVLKPGEQYCIECKRKRCTRMCTTCWDGFCDACFKVVHHGGALNSHLYMAYNRAKKGWICIKGRMKGEQDYYINGTTGETTFEKPEDLMTDQERVYYTNFMRHKEAAEKYTAQITQLQVDLEAAQYARDMLLYDSLNREGPKEKKEKKIGASDVVSGAMKGAGGIMSMFRSAVNSEYRKKILSSDDRARGKARSDYIAGLLESADEMMKETKESNKETG